MEPTPTFSKSSAFTPVKLQSHISDFFSLMETYGRQILQTGEKIKLLQYLGLIQIPFFIKLIINTLFYLLTGCQSIQVAKSIIQQITKNPLSIKIKISLFRVIVNLIQKRLCSSQPQKYYDELGFAMMFKTYLLSMFLDIVSQHSDYLKLQKIQQFYTHLVCSQYLNFLPKHMFFMYGGQGTKISKKKFTSKLNDSIKALNTHFSEGQNLIMRNSHYIKNNSEMKQILDDSILVLANLQNKNYVKQSIEKTLEGVFGNENEVSIEKFMSEMEKNIKENNDKYLWIYFDLLRLEFQLIENTQLQSFIIKRQSLDPCNYYQESMQKILKKCPYNGHQSCNCKKCQCIRRNRESAKLAQEKKRNALQQVGQMQERMKQLQKKNRQLQEMNTFLMGAIEEVTKHPEFRNIMMETFQRVSKVIKND